MTVCTSIDGGAFSVFLPFRLDLTFFIASRVAALACFLLERKPPELKFLHLETIGPIKWLSNATHFAISIFIYHQPSWNIVLNTKPWIRTIPRDQLNVDHLKCFTLLSHATEQGLPIIQDIHNIHINRAVQNGFSPWHSTAFNLNSFKKRVALDQIFNLTSVNRIMLLNNQEKAPNLIIRLIKFIWLFLRYHFGWVISRHKFHYFASLPPIFLFFFFAFFLLDCFQERVTIYKLSKLYSHQITLKP